MDFDINKFGERLKKARVACGKSQAALGSSAGLSAQAISAYEKGKQKPSIDAAAILADTLGVSLDDLCGIERKPSKEANMIPAQNGFELTNYADVVEHLSVLSNYFRCSCGTKVFEIPEEQREGDPEDENYKYYTRAALYITDRHIVDFIVQWSKMYRLYYEGVIQKDLFDTWYTGMLGKLSEIQLCERNYVSGYEVLLFGFDNDAGDIQDN